MPQVKSVKSLLESCLNYITDNINEWFVLTCDVEDITSVLNPFNQLPCAVLELVIELLREKGQLTKQIFEIIITSQLSNLDLSFREKNETLDLLNLASVKCTQLKTLRLCYHRRKLEEFVNFFPRFDKLQVLDLSSTAAEDICLHTLGAYCKDLIELNIANCREVTDVGLLGLCCGIDSLGKENETLGKCKAICKLLTLGTRITERGIKIALLNLPFLKVWDVVSIQLLVSIHQDDFLNNRKLNIPKYSLTQLELNERNCKPYRNDYLKLIGSICPSVVKLKIGPNQDLNDKDFLGLMSYKNLTYLEICGFSEGSDLQITFDNGIAPVLNTLGRSLQSLFLSCVHDVNIPAIIEHCPNLRSLHLDENFSYSISRKEKTGKEKIFTQLEKLCLKDGSHPIPPENLGLLLLSPSLKFIEIHFCLNFTDTIIQKSADNHDFRNLEYLKCVCCNSLTEQGINVLMTDRNPIKIIVLNYCDKLTEENVHFFVKKANDKNWCLLISLNHD